jgi:hypothetical protein
MNTHRTPATGKALFVVLVAGFLPLCPTAGLAIEVANSVNYPLSTSPEAVVVADFNGDGHPDIAVANSGSGNVSVLVNNGDGTFKPAAYYDAGMANPTSIDVADFNNDGIQDLAVWNLSNPVGSKLSILLGNGDGTFRAPKITPLLGTTALHETNASALWILVGVIPYLGAIVVWVGSRGSLTRMSTASAPSRFDPLEPVSGNRVLT